MKKLLIIISSAILLINLMACDKNKTNTIGIETSTSTNDVTSTTLTNGSYEKLFSEVVVPESIKVGETSIFTINEKVEGKILEKYNPYDSSSLSIDAYFKSSSGKEYLRPAYWTQDYKNNLNTLQQGNDYTYYDDEIKGTETLTKVGVEHFNVSFKPLEEGNHKLTLEIYSNGVLVETIKEEFTVIGNDSYKGKIVVNDTNKRYFMYENTHETYVPIGMNNCWYTAQARKSYDYDEWFKRMSEVGCNYSRIWMASWGFGLHIGNGSEINDFSKRLNQASRLEKTLRIAEEEGIYCYLTMLNHGQFSTSVNAEWDINSYNEILSKPYEFFTNQKAIKTYKDELRYIIARYGTYDSLLAYELFNEVDWVDFSSLYSNKIVSWHKEMAEYIRSIDCYDRPITTSYKGTLGSALKLDEIDISSIHNYAFNKEHAIDYTIHEINANFKNYNKIVLFAEWGVDANGGKETYESDPKGISLYQSMWASLMQGGAGSTMNWWWDTYIHKYNLYSLYKGIASYSKMMNLNGNLSYFNNAVSISNDLKIIGLTVDNRTYAYIYDKNYSRFNDTEKTFNESITLNCLAGNYKVKLINPRTGEIISEYDQTSNGQISVNLNEFTTDIAIIIE